MQINLNVTLAKSDTITIKKIINVLNAVKIVFIVEMMKK